MTFLVVLPEGLWKQAWDGPQWLVTFLVVLPEHSASVRVEVEGVVGHLEAGLVWEELS